jgi:hypothetical protein
VVIIKKVVLFFCLFLILVTPIVLFADMPSIILVEYLTLPYTYKSYQPMLSDKKNLLDGNISILNVQSYPTVGREWIVYFKTKGKADMKIDAFNGTEYGFYGQKDIEFLELRCSNELINSIFDGKTIFVSNYSCDGISSHIVKVNTRGVHTQRFIFGNDETYAFNDASSAPTIFNPWLNVSYIFIDQRIKLTVNVTDINGSYNVQSVNATIVYPNGTKRNYSMIRDFFNGSDASGDIESGTQNFSSYLPSASNDISALAGVGEGIGASDDSWYRHVFFDPINNRWHVVYIDSGNDIHSRSTAVNSGITWTDGADIKAGTYDFEDFDCVLDATASNTYLHCAYSDSASDFLNYIRCELTGAGSFISCGTEEVSYDASNAAENANDDIAYPRIVLGSDRCVLIVFDFEDDSEATADEHEIVMIKESSGTTCGDGDFDEADIAAGFPIYSIQTDVLGYNLDTSVGIVSFGDLDAQIFWIDTDNAASADLETIFFDGDTNTIGTQRTLDNDVEFNISGAAYYSVIVGAKTITFAMDDDTSDLDAYITTAKDGALNSQVDTGLNITMNSTALISGLVTAVVDVNASASDDIWAFAVDAEDIHDIYYAKSTDGGTNWDSPVLFVDDVSNEVKYLSAFFNPENCDIMVSWLGNASAPFGIYTKVINTESCGVEKNMTPVTYSDVDNNVWANLERINITVSVILYNTSGSIENGNNAPDLYLQMYDGADWLDIGNFSVDQTGNFTIATTSAAILLRWENVSNRDIRIKAINMDFGDSSNFDQINWTDVFVSVQGTIWNNPIWFLIFNETMQAGIYNITYINASDGTDRNGTYYNWLNFTVFSSLAINILYPSFNSSLINQEESIRLNVSVTTDGILDSIWATLKYPNSTSVNYSLVPLYVFSQISGFDLEAGTIQNSVSNIITEDRYVVNTTNSGHIYSSGTVCGNTGTGNVLASADHQVGQSTAGSGTEYRLFYTFNTEVIPDTSTVTNAKLYAYLNSETGEAAVDPIYVFSCDFGPTFENADYENVINGTNHGMFANGSTTAASWISENNSPPIAPENISITNYTQFCINLNRACQDTADMYIFEGSTAALRPYLNVTYSTPVTETNSSETIYADVSSSIFSSILKINVTVNITNISNQASIYNENTNPVLVLEAYNGTDFLFIGSITNINTNGKYSLVITEPNVLEAWLSETNRGIKLKVVNLDSNYNVSDNLSWNAVWVDITDTILEPEWYNLILNESFQPGQYNITYIYANTTDGTLEYEQYDWLNFTLILLNSSYIDSITVNGDENINLVAASNITISCSGTIHAEKGFSDILRVNATFFSSGSGFNPDSPDNKSNHFSNKTCTVVDEPGITEFFNCTFEVPYYAVNGTWTCNASIIDKKEHVNSSSNTIKINELVALDISPSSVFFGNLKLNEISNDMTMTVTHFGNVMLNMQLYGYAVFSDDGWAMNCSKNQNISLAYERFNISSGIDYEQMSLLKNYSNPYSVDFNLSPSTELYSSTKNIYWKLKIPPNMQSNSTCEGHIIFTAIVS